MRVPCRPLSGGRAEGPALVTETPLSFFGGVDPETGEVVDGASDLHGRRLGGRVLCFPKPKGSTAGWVILYRLVRNGIGPVAIVNHESDPVVASGAIVAEIPLVDTPEGPLDAIETGDRVTVDADAGFVEFGG